MKLPVIWIACFILTHIPRENVPETPSLPYIDKVVHFLMFSVLGWLLAKALYSRTDSKRTALVKTIGLLALYGIFDEVTQPIVGRTMELGDWIADVCGAACAATLAIYVYGKKKKN